MGSLPFSFLVAACLAMLLGLRFGLERALPQLGERDVSASASESGPGMQVPPKPEGLGAAPGEGSGDATALTPAMCDAMASELRDTCMQALSRQIALADPDEAIRQCGRIIDEDLAFECRADVAETIAIVHRKEAEAICVSIVSVKWRGQCHFGVGLALAETDPEYAIARCEHAEAFRTFVVTT